MESDADANFRLMKTSPVLRLRCSVQNYDWGRIGSKSLVARLHAANTGSRIDPDEPYAELWIGTHESGPSYVVQSREENGYRMTLKSWISQNPNVLGNRVLNKWGCNLPFLFKVLSVAKPLSIQAHPDKELAKVLHRCYPNRYKDDNHKPEMALAITHFEALCGFIALEELKAVLHSVPEIEELVGSEDVNQIFHMNGQDGEKRVKPFLRSVFTRLMSASADSTKKAISKMKRRMQIESEERQLTEKERLVVQLAKQYPSDVGVISAFLFNHVKLYPGEALYLGANEPHAYLSGECVECMATSDNVVRAGLTSKHRDIQTLCSMLTYKQGFPEILRGLHIGPYVVKYLPPFDEFEVDLCTLPPGESTVFHAIPGPSVFVVARGEAYTFAGSSTDAISKGDVLFVPQNTEIRVKCVSYLKLYRAGVSTICFS